MGSQCYLVEDPLYIEVPSSIVLKRHSDNHLALENRGKFEMKDSTKMKCCFYGQINIIIHYGILISRKYKQLNCMYANFIHDSP